jgi:acyl-CoA dehydrogenase
VQRFIFEYERAGRSPEQVPMGFRYVGPVISHFGSDWQKSFFLPKLLTGEHYWRRVLGSRRRVGPGGHQDDAELDGDHYVINGSKMWTTNAHWLTGCSVSHAPAHGQAAAGISFFLIELNAPGIKVEPSRCWPSITR